MKVFWHYTVSSVLIDEVVNKSIRKHKATRSQIDYSHHSIYALLYCNSIKYNIVDFINNIVNAMVYRPVATERSKDILKVHQPVSLLGKFLRNIFAKPNFDPN